MFCMRGLTIEEITPISQDRHTKLQLGRDGKSFCAFLFGMGGANCPFVCGDQVDGAFSVEINRYRGRESVQLVLRDLLWSGEEDRPTGISGRCTAPFRKGEHWSRARRWG